MRYIVYLTGHNKALWLATTVAKAHTKGRRGKRDGLATIWSVENNDGTEISLIRFDRSRAGQSHVARQIVKQGAVLLVLDGVLGNGDQRLTAGSVVCFTNGEQLTLHNANPHMECWCAMLWYQQPQLVESQ